MSALVAGRNGIQTKLLWAGIAALGAVSLGIVALNRGETISAAWLVIAALCAEGESVLHNAWHVDRGYENMPGKLAAVGAKITSEKVEPDSDGPDRTYE